MPSVLKADVGANYLIRRFFRFLPFSKGTSICICCSLMCNHSIVGGIVLHESGDGDASLHLRPLWLPSELMSLLSRPASCGTVASRRPTSLPLSVNDSRAPLC